MVRYFIHEKMVMDTAKSYQTIYDTYNKSEPELALDMTNELRNIAFQNFIIYLMVAPYDNEKVDLLNIVNTLYTRELDQNETLSKYLRKFLSFEIMPFNAQEIEEQVRAYEPFREDVTEHAKTHLQEYLRQLI
jgi:hypothetical protein